MDEITILLAAAAVSVLAIPAIILRIRRRARMERARKLMDLVGPCR